MKYIFEASIEAVIEFPPNTLTSEFTEIAVSAVNDLPVVQFLCFLRKLPSHIQHIDLSAQQLKKIPLAELKKIFAALPRTISSIDLSGNEFTEQEKRRLLFLLPPWIKACSFQQHSELELDSYWASSAAPFSCFIKFSILQTEYYRKDEMIRARLVEQVRAIMEKTQSHEPNFKSIQLFDLLDEENQYSLIADLRNYYKEPWHAFTLALIHDGYLGEIKSKSSYRNFEKECAKFSSSYYPLVQETSAKNFSLTRLRELQATTPYITVALGLRSIPKIDTTDDASALSSRLLELKTMASLVIKAYSDYNKKCYFSIFHRHGATGRKRAEHLKQTLESATTIEDFNTTLLAFLNDSRQGNTNPHSLRTLLLTYFLQELNVPGRQFLTPGRAPVSTANFSQQLQLLMEYLPHNKLPEYEKERHCCW
ncbi:hypothetical protein [Legionella clemsonensis]|uniref:Leucine Rich repeats (2 copies) n=1 Tax=Legionella clemsonensis TaxID=1867846 RepID=A0A222P0J5_9GAMM|nr:hypothetical protein [Legionella clemsonensis]ASQ45359.1 hypothetical protein clem_04005 [Legionella clemsonensis]